MRGVTCRLHCLHQQCRISTHTPHARRDVFLYSYIAGDDLFQLTRLMRGVTASFEPSENESKISTHTPHARRDLFRQ